MAHFGLHLAPPVAAGIVHSIVFFFSIPFDPNHPMASQDQTSQESFQVGRCHTCPERWR